MNFFLPDGPRYKHFLLDIDEMEGIIGLIELHLRPLIFFNFNYLLKVPVLHNHQLLFALLHLHQFHVSE